MTSETPAEKTEITISFSEQQMEIIQKLATERGKSPGEAVASAIQEFIQKEGGRYSR